MVKVLSIFLLLLSPVFAQLNADQVMANARYATTLNNIQFEGKLKSGKSTPILLKMLGKDLQIWYEKDQVQKGIRVVMDQNNCTLYDITAGKQAKFSPEHFGANIEGTDFTYEDISLRFLYWVKPEIIAEEKVKTQDCYVIRIFNPTAHGNYKFAHLWIHKNAFAVMKMEGYNANDQHIKSLEASDLMNVDDKIMMKKMKVQTIENGRVKSQSYLILNNPEGIKKTARPRKLR